MLHYLAVSVCHSLASVSVLSQSGEGLREGAQQAPIQISIWQWLWYWVESGFALIYLPFLIGMVLYCLMKDPDRYLWLWVMLLLQPIGAVVYFFVRFLPSLNLQSSHRLRRFSRRRNLPALQAAASQIGNPYHFNQLGEALQEAGRLKPAREAYQRALEKEPDNLAALWGAAAIDFQHGEFAAAQTALKRILDQDPAYKFGDVSLLYGKTLTELGETAEARTHLTQHVRRWPQSEALYRLAVLCDDQGDPQAAAGFLRTLITNIESSPVAIARKNLFWKSRARRLLRRIRT